MLSSFGTVLDRLQGLLSKGFLLAGFFPAILLASLNLALAWFVFPGFRTTLLSFRSLPPAEQIYGSVLTLMILCVLGFALWSLSPWLRHLLEGRYLPRPLREWLESLQSQKLLQLESRIDTLRSETFKYRKQQRTQMWRQALKDARETPKPPNPPLRVDPTVPEKYRKLQALRYRFRPIPFSDMEALFELLTRELIRVPAREVPELSRLQVNFAKLLDYAIVKANRDFRLAYSEKERLFPKELGHLGPTRMANISERHREYGLERYGLDVEELWIRLLKIVKKDPEFNPLLEEAKTQLDFAVGATAAVGFTTILWSPIAWWYAASPWPYLSVVILGPLATLAFYEITLQNYGTFVEAVRSAIDLHRFDLLRALHIALPANSKREKALWEKVMRWDQKEAIPYSHEESQPASNEPARTTHWNPVL
jgi:hypothetical protein